MTQNPQRSDHFWSCTWSNFSPLFRSDLLNSSGGRVSDRVHLICFDSTKHGYTCTSATSSTAPVSRATAAAQHWPPSSLTAAAGAADGSARRAEAASWHRSSGSVWRLGSSRSKMRRPCSRSALLAGSACTRSLHTCPGTQQARRAGSAAALWWHTLAWDDCAPASECDRHCCGVQARQSFLEQGGQHRSTGRVWQPVNSGQPPSKPDTPIFSRANHCQNVKTLDIVQEQFAPHSRCYGTHNNCGPFDTLHSVRSSCHKRAPSVRSTMSHSRRQQHARYKTASLLSGQESAPLQEPGAQQW